MYFEYGDKELSYLKKKDKKLAEAIDKIGFVKRYVDTDLFSSVVHHIIGQQISTAAQATIWKRVQEALVEVNADTINNMSTEDLQKLGMSFRKVSYIKSFSEKVANKEIDIDALWNKSDEEVIKELSALNGIGVWTAEMLLTFCMQRPDILSYGDLAIHRGLRMLHHHKNIDKKLFEKYRKRYSPYNSVASMYLWAIAGGAIEGMKDYAPKKLK